MSLKKIYIIHHSHTDIGYTELQHKIESWQVDFIKQALAIIEKYKNNQNQFKWTCETFWAVEKFLEQASEYEIKQFTNAVHSRNIGISANYLNFNELLGYEVLYKMIGRATTFGKSIEFPIDSAMTADINGFGWGFAQALHDNGIKNLFTCIHTHHGMYPLGKRHIAFWWETPKGDKILVWNGEHYHFGNELGLVPEAVSSYTIKDECDAEMIFADQWRVAKIRIPRFFEQLENDNYSYDFVPMMASGLRTDNGPPSAKIVENIERWNRKHGDKYRLEMMTLSEYFNILRRNINNVPVYRGDWPDWWSDGLSSLPRYTKVFKQTQRELEYYKHFLKKYPETKSESIEQIEYNLAMYAEHTFGHADSVTKPWLSTHQNIESRKQAYAVQAHELVRKCLDNAFYSLGATKLSADMPLRYKAINPLGRKVRGLIRLHVGHYEWRELKLDKGIRIFNKKTGNSVQFQIEMVPGGADYCVYVALNPEEEIILEIIPTLTGNNEFGIPNIESFTYETSLETDYVKITWRETDGIISWLDKVSEKELIRDDSIHTPFTPIYEKTPVSDIGEICSVRGEMDLNRKGENVERYIGQFKGVKSIEKGGLFTTVELEYTVEGISYYTVELRAYTVEPRVDIAARMNKDNTWEPENIYISLPFISGIKSELYLDKSGAIMRPRIDQIPGTLIDFYSIQEGLILISEHIGIAITTPDNNLIHLGDLEYRERKLHDEENPEPNNDLIYVWLMTNYWETNFSPGLGGFYEFSFSVLWGKEYNQPEPVLQRCYDTNTGISCFRMNEE